MATWADLARDNRLAANETFVRRHFRSSISRAYYAIYSAATDALVQQGITMPAGQANPKHARLPNLVGHNLTGMSHAVRWQLAGVIEKLYKLRLISDYMPQVSVDERDARMALGLMSQAFRCMIGNP
jgi:uncharacterized protein (UPF0332 family)